MPLPSMVVVLSGGFSWRNRSVEAGGGVISPPPAEDAPPPPLFGMPFFCATFSLCWDFLVCGIASGKPARGC
jgi:hypothetical protein